MAVTVDSPAQLLKTKRKLGVPFEFISDGQGSLMDAFSLRHAGGNPENGGDIPRSASILLDGQGRVLWSHVTDNYRVRPQPEIVLTAVRDALGQ